MYNCLRCYEVGCCVLLQEQTLANFGILMYFNYHQSHKKSYVVFKLVSMATITVKRQIKGK